MQADAEAGRGEAHGVGGVGLIHHEAGLGEEAGGVMAQDGVVHGGAAAEVVGGEDEVFQFVRRPRIVARQ